MQEIRVRAFLEYFFFLIKNKQYDYATTSHSSSNDLYEERYREHMKGIMENVRETENKRRFGELLNPLLLNSTNPVGLLPMVEVIQYWY